MRLLRLQQSTGEPAVRRGPGTATLQATIKQLLRVQWHVAQGEGSRVCYVVGIRQGFLA
jgi:hypothetical protein